MDMEIRLKIENKTLSFSQDYRQGEEGMPIHSLEGCPSLSQLVHRANCSFYTLTPPETHSEIVLR